MIILWLLMLLRLVLFGPYLGQQHTHCGSLVTARMRRWDGQGRDGSIDPAYLSGFVRRDWRHSRRKRADSRTGGCTK